MGGSWDQTTASVYFKVPWFKLLLAESWIVFFLGIFLNAAQVENSQKFLLSEEEKKT